MQKTSKQENNKAMGNSYHLSGRKMHPSHWQQLWNKFNKKTWLKNILFNLTNTTKMYMYQSCSHFKTSE